MDEERPLVGIRKSCEERGPDPYRGAGRYSLLNVRDGSSPSIAEMVSVGNCML